MRQHVGHAERRVAFVIVNHAAEQLDAAVAAVDDRVRRQIGRFERRRERDHLEYAARLERSRHRQIAARPRRFLHATLHAVRIVSRIVGHRQNVAGVWIQRHDRAGLGAGLDGCRSQRLLGVVLQIRIERERQVGAWLGRPRNDGIVGVLPDVVIHLGQARTPGKFIVEAHLDAGVAVLDHIVGIHHAGRPSTCEASSPCG